MRRRRISELYGAARMGVHAGRSDAQTYGYLTHDGYDHTEWVRIRNAYFYLDSDARGIFSRAYLAARNRAIRERLSQLNPQERSAVIEQAKLNRELRMSPDPAALRAKWALQSEVQGLRARVSLLESHVGLNSDAQ